MPEKKKRRIIAVIGGGEPSAEEAKVAEEVGRELARQGARLLLVGTKLGGGSAIWDPREKLRLRRGFAPGRPSTRRFLHFGQFTIRSGWHETRQP